MHALPCIQNKVDFGLINNRKAAEKNNKFSSAMRLAAVASQNENKMSLSSTFHRMKMLLPHVDRNTMKKRKENAALFFI